MIDGDEKTALWKAKDDAVYVAVDVLRKDLFSGKGTTKSVMAAVLWDWIVCDEFDQVVKMLRYINATHTLLGWAARNSHHRYEHCLESPKRSTRCPERTYCIATALH